MDSSSVARPDARDAKTQRQAELQALLARVEAATGADRELDAAICKAADTKRWAQARNWAAMPSGAPEAVIERDAKRWAFTYTASLDAALALVARCGFVTTRGFMEAAMRRCFADDVRTPTVDQWARFVLAALLKALASQQPRDQQVAGEGSRDEPLLNTSEVDEKR